MKPRVLFVTSIYHVGERVYPVIFELLKSVDVDVLCLDRMANSYPWQGDIDPRPKFKDRCRAAGARVTEKVGRPHDYSLIFYEDSWPKGDLKLLAKSFRKCGVPRVAAPHGMAWHFDRGPFFSTSHLGDLFDHVFLFGEIERQKISPPSELPYTLGGVPSNDALSRPRTTSQDYVLILAGWLPSSPFLRGKSQLRGKYRQYSVLTGEDLVMAGILDLGLPLVISQKSRPGQSLDDRSIWSPLKDFTLINDHPDHNDLVSRAAVVVGAPTTLALKSLALGKPTILFRWKGVHGHLESYPGLIDVGQDSIPLGYQVQSSDRQGVLDFSSRLSSGSLDGTATVTYCQKILEIVG